MIARALLALAALALSACAAPIPEGDGFANDGSYQGHLCSQRTAQGVRWYSC